MASFVSYFVQSVSLYIMVSRVTAIDFPLAFFLKSVISAGLMYFVIRLIRPNRIMEIVPVVILAAAFYLILMIVFRGIQKGDLNLVRKLLGIDDRQENI